MRTARLKPDHQDTWHHCYNRAAGDNTDRPFGDAEKEQFVRLLHRVNRLYTVGIVGFQVMSNHFHLLLHAPEELPSEEETCRRFEAFHGGKRKLTPGTPLCRQWQVRLRDLSWFMRHLEHLFSAWFNRTRPIRRRGHLWAGRFKNTVLESGSAVWACAVYLERNPVRAGMVEDPADYRFCSYGVWAQSGRHPFEKNVERLLLPMLGNLFPCATLADVQRHLRESFAFRAAVDVHSAPEQVDAAVEEAAKPVAFSLSAQRRMRYWVDGLAIGSELFLRDLMRRVRDPEEVERHRLAQAVDVPAGAAICCWRRLRVNVA